MCAISRFTVVYLNELGIKKKKDQELRMSLSAASWLIEKSVKEVQLLPPGEVKLLKGTETLSHRMAKYIVCYWSRKCLSELYEKTLIGTKRKCML